VFAFFSIRAGEEREASLRSDIEIIREDAERQLVKQEQQLSNAHRDAMDQLRNKQLKETKDMNDAFRKAKEVLEDQMQVYVLLEQLYIVLLEFPLFFAFILVRVWKVSWRRLFTNSTRGTLDPKILRVLDNLRCIYVYICVCLYIAFNTLFF
jgi:hypothetical protein